ncbi:YbaB/EbfC family nucleoid-associated protein [Streptomyces sp. NPDC056632]|uniref:YbaB/EbfC family nucleoid-associated protein n=1 Tax=Streptomyces sp. NPDC056632 TaxID=3345884 RepID=UPI0036BDB29D
MLDPANEARLQEILSNFEKTRDTVLAAQGDLKERTYTFKSPDKSVSATLDAQGQLTAFTFHNTKYRQLSQKELGKLVVDTVQQAFRNAQSTVAAALRPVLEQTGGGGPDAPGGVNPWEMLPDGMSGANGDLMKMIRDGMQDAMKDVLGSLPTATPAAKPRSPRTTKSAARKPAPRSTGGTLDDD